MSPGTETELCPSENYWSTHTTETRSIKQICCRGRTLRAPTFHQQRQMGKKEGKNILRKKGWTVQYWAVKGSTALQIPTGILHINATRTKGPGTVQCGDAGLKLFESFHLPKYSINYSPFPFHFIPHTQIQITHVHDASGEHRWLFIKLPSRKYVRSRSD